jgi:hypothetical protein
MPDKNQKNQQDKNKMTENNNDNNRQQNNTGGNKSTAVNEGNPANHSGRERSNRELHTKSAITGSDSDGQAD